ncbi:hypothetical protein NP493_767g01026 [Ridgeia piscesae]|uniref:FAM20 C-terminal domain-containing protein n=1 Tax=Ridgeia piscesae TaxID=27915 RepID=A0AAD9NM05_RIDPI|nr:hypothetical protein NP493_767g01026 [Ridgeia piscesae]
MAPSWTRMLYSRTNLLLLCIVSLGSYLLLVDQSSRKTNPDEFIDMAELDAEVDRGNPVRIVSYVEVMQNYQENKSSENFKEDVDLVVDAMVRAQIVSVEAVDTQQYEGGTSEKWIVHLEGGQKAMMKLMWLLGFRNTPYVTGRKVHLRDEVLPVASPTVAKQIISKSGSETCVVASCQYCKEPVTKCFPDGVVEVSLAYWVPRKLQLHTYPPDYMPYSTPQRKNWGKMGFNNRTFCDSVHRKEPYDSSQMYLDLFDFAVLDTLMYHFDSKHYTISDNSVANGATVRLDHGRAFCASDRDDVDIFLAPITQCCTLRKTTYNNLKPYREEGRLTSRLRQALSQDPLAPILDGAWFPALERRLKSIFQMLDRCVEANGFDKVFVDDT